MLISKQQNEALYYYIFKDDNNRDVDDLIFKDAELPVSEK
jgi:hypothetical protein